MAKNKSKVAGGLARALVLSPERKRAIAAKAAATRWGKVPVATHKGNFRQDFGIDVDCYVLNDENRTAVVSQRGMAVAIGLSDRGQVFPNFAKSKGMSRFVGTELRSKIDNPLIFQAGSGGIEQPPQTAHGYDVTLLVDFCKAILEADAAGALVPRQKPAARQARIILNASAKAGIKGLVYALAGYDATREEIITAFKFYVREEAREYEKEFPDQLYTEWHRLYEPSKPERGKPWKFKHLTVQQVYEPLAHSNGKVLDLTRAQRAAKREDRHKKLHQFLSDVGVKALRTHLGQLLGIARISDTKAQYESHWNKLFGNQPDLPGLER